MKKCKYLLILVMIIVLTGCGNNSMENIEIQTTSYPIEYITERLYGEHSTIKSIYPDDMDNDYVVSDKLLKDYSSADLFVFNGTNEKENDYVYKMFENNKKLKIIDVTSSLTYNNKIEELWLDPMNLLTIANNIKKGFKEYTNINYLLEDIDKNYNKLRLELIQLDADYRDMANRANNKTIVVGDDLFLYLKKYDINVLSVEESVNLTNKTVYTAEELIKSGNIKYVYIKKGTKPNKKIKEWQEKYQIEIIELHSLYTLTDAERKNKTNYFNVMHDNLEALKLQLYN